MHRVLMSLSAPVCGAVSLRRLNSLFQYGGLMSWMVTSSLHWLEPPWASVTVRVDSVHGSAAEACGPRGRICVSAMSPQEGRAYSMLPKKQSYAIKTQQTGRRRLRTSLYSVGL